MTARSASTGGGRGRLKAAPYVEPLRAKPRLAALGVLAELHLARGHRLVERIQRAAGVRGRSLGVHPAGRRRVWRYGGEQQRRERLGEAPQFLLGERER